MFKLWDKCLGVAVLEHSLLVFTFGAAGIYFSQLDIKLQCFITFMLTGGVFIFYLKSMEH